MYAGLLLTNNSGNLMGAHQKFNRVSRRHLAELLGPDTPEFPSIKQILHFEGKNGPDGLKAKCPGGREPSHFYDPFDPDETDLLIYLRTHYAQLVEALKDHNMHKAAFESSWLAHALTDGLTPAHHYPYEQELSDLRSKSGEISNIKDKLVIGGHSNWDLFKRNWSFWGPKGLFMTHAIFELGVAGIVKPMSIDKGLPSNYDLKTVKHLGIEEVFKRAAREVAMHNIYDRLYKRGWTPGIAKDVREELAPTICKVVTLAWHSAVLEAQTPSNTL